MQEFYYVINIHMKEKVRTFVLHTVDKYYFEVARKDLACTFARNNCQLKTFFGEYMNFFKEV